MWRPVENFTINYRPYIAKMSHLTSCAMCNQLQRNLIFKHCMAITTCVTSFDTMLQRIARRAAFEFFMTFHSHGTRATYSILGRGESSTVVRGGYVSFGHKL